MLDNASILVTGGTGSFGQALARKILARHKPKRLVVFSRDEQKHYRMAQALPPSEHHCLRYFVGDVRDRDRLQMALDGVDYVIHAAAMKHVPIAEYNPFECIRTNVEGAENVVLCSRENNVRRVVALSTDKAANPINLYGATKLCADKCFVAGNHLSNRSSTRFAVVRYGNVVGSNGSAVRLFHRLVQQGASRLPITSREMTRFWISLHRATNFVLDCMEAMQGGEIFVPKIPSMRIDDLAKVIGPGCELEEVGIRPGEKLHETLIPVHEARQTREFDDGYIIYPSFSWWDAGEAGGKPVKDGFEYASNTNPWMLQKQDLERMFS